MKTLPSRQILKNNQPQFIELHSSYRLKPAEETIASVHSFAEDLGVSRVTDITRLDKVGVPVYASIRPNAVRRSLCVNAGKGYTNAEAKAGAYMEAIEFALAEYGGSSLESQVAAPRDLLGGIKNAALDLCPAMGVEVDLRSSIGTIEAVDILSDNRLLVPSELIFLPCPEEVYISGIYGSSSNGLSSGNSVLEATIHGLLEVIERDIRSFQSVNDSSQLVEINSTPTEVIDMARRIEAAGLSLFIRYMRNQYNLPYFMSIIADTTECNPIYVSGGYACHLSNEISLKRSVTEAIQSRLSFIHGGRDDLEDRYKKFEGFTEKEKYEYANRFIQKVSNKDSVIKFGDTPDFSTNVSSLDESFVHLTESLDFLPNKKILRAVYTNEEDPVQVVRVIVPKLEFFTDGSRRVGIRLRDHVRDTLR